MDVKSAVEAAKGGEVQFKVEKAGLSMPGSQGKLLGRETGPERARLRGCGVQGQAGRCQGAYLKNGVAGIDHGPGVAVDLDLGNGN